MFSKRAGKLVSLAALALTAGLAGWWWKPDKTVTWRTARVDRGDITRRIQATGTLNALIQVPVGTQVSGVVTALYADFNSLVRKGQILARIDPTLLESQLMDARAAMDGAMGTYENAKVELARYQALAAERLISASELDAKQTAFKAAKSALDSAREVLKRARTNLDYCTIKAPVEGVVVSRVVDVGQTVAASLSAPSLFSVAQDLSRMKLQAAIDEADIGQVSVGQSASFTVDSYPDIPFQANVCEVQLNPTVSNNVVTYNVVLGVANVPRPGGSTAEGKSIQTALYLPKGGAVYQ
jgi:HlyD family secretion protein